MTHHHTRATSSPWHLPRTSLILALTATPVFLSACAGDPTEPEAPPVATVLGRVYAPGFSSFSGLIARVVWRGMEETAPVGSDGRFMVGLPDSVKGPGFLTIEPDAGVGLHPAFVLLAPGDAGHEGTIILMPARWSIETGDHAGTTVDIDPDLASDSRVMPSFWGTHYPFSQDGFFQAILDNTVWAGDLKTWPADAFPIPLALDRIGSRGDEVLTARDSTLFWNHVDAFERALGRDVFQAVRVEDVEFSPASRKPLGAVVLRLDTNQPFLGQGRADIRQPYTWALTADTWQWSGTQVRRLDLISADIRGGSVTLRNRDLLADRQLVAHNLMHVLGVGHGCSWASVQTFCTSLLVDLPSAEDVAHLEALEAVRDMERERGTRWGLVAAILGYRTVTLGLPPIPDAVSVYGPSTVSGR